MSRLSSALFVLAVIAGCSASDGTSSTLTPHGTNGAGDDGGTGITGQGGAGSDGGLAGGADASNDSGGRGGADGGNPLPTTASLGDRLSTVDVGVPEGALAGANNWRVWGATSLGVAPVFTVPRTNCGTLVCFTTGKSGAKTARLAVLDAASHPSQVMSLGAFECRGLAAEPDGRFAALLWDQGAQSIHVQRFDPAGHPEWSAALTNTDNAPTDFGIGDSRLEYGNGKYGAYYHVHSTSGHEGDTLKWIAAADGSTTDGWSWGCSHSMSVLLRYASANKTFMPACVTDCYPGTSGSNFATDSIGGVYINNSQKVIDVDAGCNGSVAGELGGGAVAPSGWKVVFNGHQNAAAKGQSSYDPKTMNQDIGFASIGANLKAAGSVVWLTSTQGVNEADSAIERWQPAGDATEQYVVGWSAASGSGGAGAKYFLARVDASGKMLEGPTDLTAKARWGRRDDPFRGHVNGDVAWSWFDAAGATTLHVARLQTGAAGSCATY